MTLPETDSTKAIVLGDCRIEAQRNRVIRGDNVVLLENKTMEVLMLLVSRAGQVVSGDEIIEKVWSGRAMGDSPVYKSIAQIRGALGDEAKAPRYIETIPRRGYRLKSSSLQSHADSISATRQSPVRWLAPLAAVLVGSLALVLYLSSGVEPADPMQSPHLGENSIAVLPFVNVSGNSADDILSHGLADELINRLAQIEGLRLIARGSAFLQADRTPDETELADALAVDYTLSGSITASERGYRVYARLLKNDGSIIWSDSYDRSRQTLTTIQDDIAAEVISGLSEILGAQLLLPHSRTQNFSAYSAYLLGNELKARRPPGWADEAQDAFEDAIRLDPAYAPPYAGLAVVLLLRDADLTGAENYIETAMSLDANLAEAYEAAGLLASMRGKESDLLEAESLLRRAVALNPSLINARSWLSIALQTMNRKQEAMEVLIEAIRIDPLNGVMNLNLGKRYQDDGQLDRARAQMERAMRFPDTGAYGWFWIADLEITRGHYDRALQFMKNATQNGDFDNEQFQWHAGVIAVYYARLGLLEQAKLWQEQYDMPEATDWHFSQDYHYAIATGDIATLRKMMELHNQTIDDGKRPLSLLFRSTLGKLAARLGNYEESIEILAPIFEGDWTYQNAPGGAQDTVDTLLFYAVSLQRTGRATLAESLLQTALERLHADYAGATALPAVVPVRRALIHSLLGDYDTAIQHFTRGVEKGWRDSFVIPGNPCWDEFRDDEEFQRLLELINNDLAAQRDKVRIAEQLQPFTPR